jgi:CubicO group peptidase (beta-lactamase class C family)
MDAVLALRQGTVVYERYKTMRHFDKHNWFSASKTVAGTLTALLAHEGRIDLTKPVSHYVTELAGSTWDDVSVEATMDMATGLDSTEHDEQPVDDGRTNPQRGWFKWAVSIGLSRALTARRVRRGRSCAG